MPQAALTSNFPPLRLVLSMPGEAGSHYELASMYARGEGVPQDAAEALVWYRKAADQDYALAQYALARMYSSGQGVPQDQLAATRQGSVRLPSDGSQGASGAWRVQ